MRLMGRSLSNREGTFPIYYACSSVINFIAIASCLQFAILLQHKHKTTTKRKEETSSCQNGSLPLYSIHMTCTCYSFSPLRELANQNIVPTCSQNQTSRTEEPTGFDTEQILINKDRCHEWRVTAAATAKEAIQVIKPPTSLKHPLLPIHPSSWALWKVKITTMPSPTSRKLPH